MEPKIKKSREFRTIEYTVGEDRLALKENPNGEIVQATIMRGEREVELYQVDLILLLSGLELHGAITKKP